MDDIIKTVVGSIIGKARNVVSNKLSEGDLTDENFKGVIAREINEINKKLDALGRKDLLSSVQFLKEGLNRLLMAMDKKSMNSKVPTTSRNVKLDTLTAVDDASTSQRLENAAFTISNVIANKFEVVSLERLKNAKKSFEESRKEATRAFANEALSIDDRIMATKLRIVSRILESFLDDPEAGASDCLLYLKELHSLPAVRETYSVYVGGGLKSYFKSSFNKEKRKEKVETIRSVNTAVRDFIAGFTTKVYRDSVNWPTIQLRNNEKSTFYSKKKIAEKHAELNEYRRMEARWPDIETTTSHKQPVSTCVSRLAQRTYNLVVKPSLGFAVMPPGGFSFQLCSATDVSSHWVYHLNYKHSIYFKIFVFESNMTFCKSSTTTDLPRGSDVPRDVFSMRVLQDKIAVLRDRIDCRRIHFVDISTGKTSRTISLPPQPKARHSSLEPCINILNDSEIMFTRSYDKAVYIYTNEGQLKQTIHLPLEEAFTICDIAYRAASEEILVLTSVSQDSESSEEESYEQLSPKELLSYRLLVYSTNGALKDTYYLSRESLQDKPRFINCSEGRVAIANKAGFQICL